MRERKEQQTPIAFLAILVMLIILIILIAFGWGLIKLSEIIELLKI